MHRTPQQQLVHFLSDMYAVEQQALAQMVTAPKIAGDPGLAADFRLHHTETEEQAELVRERLEALGGSPSVIKDMIMKIGGKGFLLFARVMPETPGRLVDHAYSYEAMEWAAYEMLKHFAQHVGDQKTVEVAVFVGAQERAMMQRLERKFDAAETASHNETPHEKLRDHVRTHLAEVHAFESQTVELLKKSEKIAGSPVIAAVYSRALDQVQHHSQLVEERLKAIASDTSAVKDSALTLGGINWGLFFQAQSDTPAKLAAFVYAVLHLEIGGYELLKRTAVRTGDAETMRLCERIIADKRVLAEQLAAVFHAAAEATIDSLQKKKPDTILP